MCILQYTEKEVETLTSINLLDIRQCQAHLIPINSWPIQLQRIALEINSLQLLLIPELALNFLKASKLIIRTPQLLEVL